MHFCGHPVRYIVCGIVSKRASFVPQSVCGAAFLSILEHVLLFTLPLGKVAIMEIGLITSNISLSLKKNNVTTGKKIT